MSGSAAHFTIAVRAKPGARRPGVGGSYGDPPQLVVAVSARAVDGAANTAVVDAVAEAFGVAKSDVRILRGERGRSKLVTIEGDPERLQTVLQQLLGY